MLPERTLLPVPFRRTLLALGAAVLVSGLVVLVVIDSEPLVKLAVALYTVLFSAALAVPALDPRRGVVVDREGFGVERPRGSRYRVAWSEVAGLALVGRKQGVAGVQVHDLAQAVSDASRRARSRMERWHGLLGHLPVVTSRPAPEVLELMERYRAEAR